MTNDARKEKLRNFMNRNCLLSGHFTLSAGTTTNFYFDCKRATLNGEMLAIISDLLIDEMRSLTSEAVAISGLTLGADPLICGVIVRAHERNLGINGCIVRKEPKKYGSQNHIENDIGKGTPVVVVDDVITTGSATAKACDCLIEAGYKISGILAVVDRLAGGAQTLGRKYGCGVNALFTIDDFPAVKKAAAN